MIGVFYEKKRESIFDEHCLWCEYDFSVACSSAASEPGHSDSGGEEQEQPYVPETLESNGIPLGDYKIVLSAEASEAEKYAAQVLRDNIQKAGQVVPEVITDETAETANEILIGQTTRSEDDSVDFVALGDESYIVRTVGNDLVIAANDKRGVIYGVYAYLDALGFRYYTPDCEKFPMRRRCLSQSRWIFLGRLPLS